MAGTGANIVESDIHNRDWARSQMAVNGLVDGLGGSLTVRPMLSKGLDG